MDDLEIDFGSIDWGDNGLQSYDDFISSMTDSAGNWTYDAGSIGAQDSVLDWLGGIAGTFGTTAANALKGLVTDSKGNINMSKVAALGGGIAGGLGLFDSSQQKTGYQGGIPELTAVREQVPGTYDHNRRPGSRGQEYMTQTQFVSPSDVATAKASAAEEAKAAEARNKARAAEPQRAEYAAGGLATMAKGRYLNGATDGMEDKLDATIDNKQPAKLSHGEFVVPADIVSHLGNGNSEAGATRLYEMMDRIRKARTGTTKQGKQINPNKFLPG